MEIFRLLNSESLPWTTPIECEVNYYRLGRPVESWLPVQGLPDPDPIHTFFMHPQRYILRHTEMAQYPVLLLQYIDVESTQAMADYLARGGFAVVNPGQLSLLFGVLQQRYTVRVQQISVGLEHPLFHCQFDITQYWDANRCGCPALAPLPGLELDGRLVALCCPPFVLQCPCQSNKLYVDVLVYGLIQPSRMGGRYWSVY